MSNPEEIFSWRKLVEFLRYNECRWNLNWIWKLFCNKFSYKYGTTIYFFIICFKTSSWKYSKWNLHMSIFIEIEYNLVSKFDTHHYVIWKFQVKIWHNHFSYNYNFFLLFHFKRINTYPDSHEITDTHIRSNSDLGISENSYPNLVWKNPLGIQGTASSYLNSNIEDNRGNINTDVWTYWYGKNLQDRRLWKDMYQYNFLLAQFSLHIFDLMNQKLVIP